MAVFHGTLNHNTVSHFVLFLFFFSYFNYRHPIEHTDSQNPEDSDFMALLIERIRNDSKQKPGQGQNGTSGCFTSKTKETIMEGCHQAQIQGWAAKLCVTVTTRR